MREKRYKNALARGGIYAILATQFPLLFSFVSNPLCSFSPLEIPALGWSALGGGIEICLEIVNWKLVIESARADLLAPSSIG